MTLDEAIKHCEEKAKEIRKANEEMPTDCKLSEDLCECAREHEQLAEWLKELKAYKEASNNDLISRTELKKCAIPCQIQNGALTDLCVPLYQIDNAPTVDTYTIEDIQEVRENALILGAKLAQRPQGEREFIEILAQTVPEDLCTYPEYRGKPYYSIHYKENGEEFVGFGTYNPEVLSRYLKEYFLKGGVENE